MITLKTREELAAGLQANCDWYKNHARKCIEESRKAEFMRYEFLCIAIKSTNDALKYYRMAKMTRGR